MSTLEPHRSPGPRSVESRQAVEVSAFERPRPPATTGATFIAGWPVIGPLLATAAVTLLFRHSNLDLLISALFYDTTQHVWTWFYNPLCTLFYRRGTYPGFALVVAGALLGAWGLLGWKQRGWHIRAGTYLWVVFLIGPGLVVNLSLKNHWGRPRPHQVDLFGGPHHFVPVLTPSEQQPHNASFPSGHAAMAFFLIAPAFLVDRRRPGLARGLLAAGLVFGTAMSAVRVIQGGHFVSDVVWSAAIVYFTCLVCAHVILQPRRPAVELPTIRGNSGRPQTSRLAA